MHRAASVIVGSRLTLREKVSSVVSPLALDTKRGPGRSLHGAFVMDLRRVQTPFEYSDS